jgi:hypothetical protein
MHSSAQVTRVLACLILNLRALIGFIPEADVRHFAISMFHNLN